MSSAAIAFVHAVCKRSQKCLAQKVARFGSLGWIPMIQVPFNSSCVALQYETGTTFFYLAVLELHAVKNSIKIDISQYKYKLNEYVQTNDNTALSRYYKDF